MATVTESLVDAKDEARQAEVRLDLSEAIRDFETSMATWGSLDHHHHHRDRGYRRGDSPQCRLRVREPEG